MASSLPLLLPLLLLCLSLPVSVVSQLTVSNLFTSNMVLQRYPYQATMWGTATPNSTVSLTIDSQDPQTTVAAQNGYWRIHLYSHPAGFGHTLTLTSGSDTPITLTNVGFGDVYLCSGQSNMQINLGTSFGGVDAIARAATSYPNIRVFNIPQAMSNTSRNTTANSFSQWMAPSTASLTCGTDCIWNQFSATCWYTAQTLYDALNGTIPIGLLHASYGGTMVETWTSPDVIAQGECGPLPTGSVPSMCYNALIHPLLPMTFTAVLWYQGESNSNTADRYACAFPAMIRDWRQQFGQPNLPFYFVQIAAWKEGGQPAVNVRAAQLAALQLPRTGVASAIDLGDEASPYGAVHPRNKSYVGERLARWVLRDVYGQRMVVSGPMVPEADAVSAVTDAAGGVRVVVKYGDGEVNAGLRLIAVPGCITCCGASGGDGAAALWVGTRRYPLNTTIDADGRTLYLQGSLPSPPSPNASVTIALHWDAYPECVLYNSNLLPALPFAISTPLRQSSGVLTLPVLFSSDMVLQRGPASAVIWGTSPPLAKVSASLNGAAANTTTSDQVGHWQLSLPPHDASTGWTLSVTDGTTTVTYTGVSFGDVYLCSGQSNMELALSYSFGGMDEIAQGAAYTDIRLFNIPHESSLTPLDEVKAISYKQGWVYPNSSTLWSGNPADNMGIFSAVCWYTGKQLSLALNHTVPIGLLASTFGGTVVEAWTSIERNPPLDNQCGPIAPLARNENNTQNQPAGSYNAMIHPLLPMTLKAVLWYQGENNRYEAWRYGCAFPVMIEDWRDRFRQPDLPFYFVLLAAESDGSNGTTTLRQGQLQATRLLRHTGVANAIDGGDPGSTIGAVHSRNKSIVGDRLARLLLHDVYHRLDVQSLGPVAQPADVTVTLSADASTYLLQVVYSADSNNHGLFVLPTPYCNRSCCSPDNAGLISLQYLADPTSPPAPHTLHYPPITVDPVGYVLMGNVSSPLNLTDVCVGMATPNVRVQLEWEGYPGCALYNDARLPSLPWTVDVGVDTSGVDCGGGGGGGGGDSGGWGAGTYAALAGVVVGAGLVIALAIILKRRSDASAEAGGGRGGGVTGPETAAGDANYSRLDEPLTGGSRGGSGRQ